MRGGNLNEKMTARRLVKTQDAIGGDTITYTTLGDYWVEVRWLPSPGEPEAANQRWGLNKCKLKMRYRPDIALRTEDQFVWGSRVLNILDVHEYTQDGYLDVFAQEYRA